LNKLGHFVGFHQISNHGNFIFTKKVAQQPYCFFLFSNWPLNSTTNVKKLENSMKELLLWKTVEIALKSALNESRWPYEDGNSTFLGEIILRKLLKNGKYQQHFNTKHSSLWMSVSNCCCSSCFMLFLVFVLYGPFCHVALKLDLSTLCTPFVSLNIS